MARARTCPHGHAGAADTSPLASFSSSSSSAFTTCCCLLLLLLCAAPNKQLHCAAAEDTGGPPPAAATGEERCRTAAYLSGNELLPDGGLNVSSYISAPWYVQKQVRASEGLSKCVGLVGLVGLP